MFKDQIGINAEIDQTRDFINADGLTFINTLDAHFVVAE